MLQPAESFSQEGWSTRSDNFPWCRSGRVKKLYLLLQIFSPVLHTRTTVLLKPRHLNRTTQGLIFSQDGHSFQTAALRLKALTVPQGRSSSFTAAGTSMSALFQVLWEALQGALRGQGLKNQQRRRVQSRKHLHTLVIFLYEAKYSENPCACPKMPPPPGT